MENQESVRTQRTRPRGLFRYALPLASVVALSGCLSIGVFKHNHPIKAAVFIGLQSYTDATGTSLDGPEKSFHQPRFIYLEGVEGREVTWTLKGSPGDSAVFSGLYFMEDVDPDTPDWLSRIRQALGSLQAPIGQLRTTFVRDSVGVLIPGDRTLHYPDSQGRYELAVADEFPSNVVQIDAASQTARISPAAVAERSGIFALTPGQSKTLRLRTDIVHAPVYEFRITVFRNGVPYPVNYPVKIIP